MTNGTAAAGVLSVVLLLQLALISGDVNQMVTHDNKGGDDIQHVKWSLESFDMGLK